MPQTLVFDGVDDIVTIPNWGKWLPEPSWEYTCTFALKEISLERCIFQASSALSSSFFVQGDTYARFQIYYYDVASSIVFADLAGLVLDQVYTVLFKKVSPTQHELWLDGVLQETVTTDTTAWTQRWDFATIGGIGVGNYSGSHAFAFHSSTATGNINPRHYDANASNGVGYSLAETVSSQNGTLNNFPNDFSQWVGVSAADPIPDAGVDQIDRLQGGVITLDGTGSYDPDGTISSYVWAQTAGTTVTLSNANVAQPTFTAPNSAETLTFQLTVIDNNGLSATDTVNITVGNLRASGYLTFDGVDDVVGIPSWSFLTQPAWELTYIHTNFDNSLENNAFLSSGAYASSFTIDVSRVRVWYNNAAQSIIFPDIPAYVDGETYEIKIVKNNASSHELWVNGALINTQTTDTSTWTQLYPFAFIGGLSDTSGVASQTQRFYSLSVTGITDPRTYDALPSSGTAYILEETVQGKDGILMNFPTDYSQWTGTTGADGIIPVITVSGATTTVITAGDPEPQFTAFATDNLDGDITADIVVGGDVVNASVAGLYTITYNVVDSSGNNALQVNRTIDVKAVPALVITPSATTIDAGQVLTLTANVTDASFGDSGLLQAPPVLDNPLVVSNYDNYIGTSTTRVINGLGGDVMLLAHAPNGVPIKLKNVRLNLYNFRRVHIKGLEIELDDPNFPENRALNFTTAGSGGADLIEEIFIEGLRIENNFMMPSSDAIALYYIGTAAAPCNRFVLQNSSITGVGIAGTDDGIGAHPDLLQFQALVFITDVYIENFTGSTMYQGFFCPWDDANSPQITAADAPNWHFKNVNISSEDSSTNRLLVMQNEGKTAAEFPTTTFDNVYLSQGQTHSFGVGAAAIHVNPNLTDSSPYEFVPEADITGVPFAGRAPADFAPESKTGIFYNPSPSYTYLWSSGETTQTISVTAPIQENASLINRSVSADDGINTSNTASISVTVNGSGTDSTAPVITIAPTQTTYNLTVGDAFTPPVATSTDAIDGTQTITPTGTVNMSVAGTYTLTYTDSDVAGNAATPVIVTVNVSPSIGNNNTVITIVGIPDGTHNLFLVNQVTGVIAYNATAVFSGGATSVLLNAVEGTIVKGYVDDGTTSNPVGGRVLKVV